MNSFLFGKDLNDNLIIHEVLLIFNTFIVLTEYCICYILRRLQVQWMVVVDFSVFKNFSFNLDAFSQR